MELRTNSLRVRFEKSDPEPSDMEIFSFMKGKMLLKSDNLLSMYKEKNELSVIIKFKKEEDAQRVLMRLPDIMDFQYNKYQCTKVKLSMANAIVRYVRLFNLNPEVENQEIQKVMSKYGTVIRMVREKYGEETGFPIWTSVRGVYIEMKDDVEIPATLLIRNMRARIFYEGLVNRCFQCGSAEHMKAECPQRKSVSERLHASGPSSYSGALSGAGNWTKKKAEGTQSVIQQNGGLQFTKLTSALNTSAIPDTSENNSSSVNAVGFNNHAASSSSVVTKTTDKGKNVDNEMEKNEAKPNNPHAAAHKQIGASTATIEAVEKGSKGKEKDNTQTSENEQSGVSTTVGVDSFTMFKNKRGRKHATKEKADKASDSEHSTTESDYREVSETGKAKRIITRNKAKQLKLGKVDTNPTEISDASYYSENKTDNVEIDNTNVSLQI